MNLRLNANAIVTNKEGKILINKLKGGPYAGFFCIPGGGVNPGELSFDTIKREIKEETGIEIAGDTRAFGFCELIRSFGGTHRVVLLFHAKGNGDPKETEEAEAKWMEIEEAEKDSIPFTKEAIRIWKENKTHFTIVE
jgi:8-oxo-dGTP diphosphatase